MHGTGSAKENAADFRELSWQNPQAERVEPATLCSPGPVLGSPIEYEDQQFALGNSPEPS
jgi:hypothetical protein